jgi:hypothetical protein
MRMTHNRYQNSWGINYSTIHGILKLGIVVAIGMYILQKTQPTIISPVPESYSSIQWSVEASKKKVRTPSEIEEVYAYIVQTFEKHGKNVVKQAIDIANCESRMNIKAYNFNKNGTGDYSVFQINSVHIKKYGEQFMHDWKENVRVAEKIYAKQGWNPWVCRRVINK